MLRHIGPRRLLTSALFLAAALVLARYSWHAPLISGAERALYDVRQTITAPRIAQDPRIVLVLYKEETLERTGKRSPLDRGLLARAMARIDAMNPKGMAVDILLDQAEPEDKELVATLKTLHTPTFLAFASHVTNPTFMQPPQEKFLRGFMADLAGSHVKSAMINLDTDADGVVRRWPTRFRDEPPPVSLALHPADHQLDSYLGAVAFRQQKFEDHDLYASYPIDLFETPAAAMLTDAIKGKYVLIGADLADYDRFPIPATTMTRLQTFGLRVHADLLAQALDGFRARPVPSWALWIAAVLAVLSGVVAGVSDTRRWWFWPLLATELAVILATPFLLQARGYDTLSTPMFGWLLGWALSLTGVAAAARSLGAEQRQFAHTALGKYLPRDVARAILRDPERMSLSGEKKEIYAVFSDLEGFTALSHQLEPEMVAMLINRYLDMLSEVVLDHGGTVDKFVGDSIVAFWGAPLAREDDADRAMSAAVALHRAGEAFRANAPEGVPAIGRTRVGLHRGLVIVGNFGGEGRMQYTAFGDVMNTAARLEGANKALKSGVLVSAAASSATGVEPLRFAGRVMLRGRSHELEVYQGGSGFDFEACRDFNARVARFDAGDGAAWDEITAIAAKHPDDEALQNLVERLREAGPGGYSTIG